MKRAILIFDSECPLCVRFKQSLFRLGLEEQLEARPVADSSLYAEYPELDPARCEEAVHLITQDERVLVGDEVVKYLIALHPKVKSFSWLIESKAGQNAMELFYQAASKVRKEYKKYCPRC